MLKNYSDTPTDMRRAPRPKGMSAKALARL